MVENSFITTEGRAKLEEELTYLRDVKRREIAENLKAAADDGDITENSAYDETKREQAFVEGRILEIEGILSSAQELDIKAVHTTAALGAVITLVEDGNEPETYTIVGRTEADPARGRISNESPLGKALLGRRKGERVHVNTPGGELRVRIINVD